MTVHSKIEDSNVQVEVNVQDCYDDFDLAASNLELSKNHSNSTVCVDWQTVFEQWLAILHPLPPAAKYELSLRLTDDAQIQAYNAQYRHIDKPTDVLAFAALEVDFPQPEQISEDTPLYLGDIVISIDTAIRQAQQQKHTLQTELAWLAAHGLLHLLGWDHPDEDSLLQMLDRQTIMLNKVGFTVNLT